MNKPATLKPNVANFPPQLSEFDQWVSWKWTRVDGRWTKVPYMLTKQKKASSTDPSTWTDFKTMETQLAKSNGKLDGPGYVLAPEDPFIMIDHDHCRDPETGEISQKVQKQLKLIDSYVEVSPSGTGIRQIVIGNKPGKRCKQGNFEIYEDKRFVTLTGHVIPGYSTTIEERQDAINELYSTYFCAAPAKTTPAAPAPASVETTTCVIDDTIIIEKLLKSEKAKKLWAGDYSGYSDNPDSQNEADLALCSEIARHTGSDPQTIDRVFRQSGLMRSKWNSRRGDSTYGQMTVARVLASPPRRKYKYHLTDTGNGERFADQHRGGVLYNHLSRKWHAWDGIRWKQDDTGKVMLKTKDTVRSIYAEAASEPDSDRRKDIGKWAKSSEARMKRKDMLTCAQSEPGIPILPSQLDRDPWLFNVMNGTINLRDGSLMPHNPENLITKLAPFAYDPAAKCPLWMKFLNQIMRDDQEDIKFLQRAVGYGLTGLTWEQCLFFLYGHGANGKSTFLETIKFMLGDYGIQTDFGTFTSKKFASIRNDIARLQAARFVGAVEAGEDTKFDEPLLKHVTGGDTVTARYLYQEYFEFTPHFKIWLAANHRPIITGDDHAIWRRIRLVPFEVTIPSKKQDPKLPEKLKKEIPGLFNWALEGCMMWQRDGLPMPDKVKKATSEYRSEMDVLSDFIAGRCVIDPHEKVLVSELYAKYYKWHLASVTSDTEPVSKKSFTQKLERKGIRSKRHHRGRFYHGIGLEKIQP